MTEYKRFELLDGVYLTAVHTDACARSCLSMTLLTQLSQETAAMNAVLPDVLMRGSSRLPDTDAVMAALASMDGEIVPVVRKLGELQAVGLRALFAHEAFEPMAQELTAMLLSPNTRGGLLRPDWVKDAAAALPARQAVPASDAERYAAVRLTQEMCCFEDYAVPVLGDEEGAKAIHYQKLTRRYHDLLAASPLEIFYCGTEPPRKAAQTLAELLVTMPRGEPDEELGTDVRMNSVDASPRIVEEAVEGLHENRLAVGWRLGDQMEEPDVAALRLLAACLEQALRSKLDERTHVCLDLHKGLLTLHTPLHGSRETACGVIEAQLELLRAGAPDESVRAAALEALSAQLLQTQRDAAALEHYWLERATLGLLYSPEELDGLLHEVSPADVTDAARALECDMIYVCTAEPVDESDSLEA